MKQIVEKLRRQSGFSSSEVAEYLAISEKDYLRYETEDAELPFDILERLADLYHVEEYDILTGSAVSQTVTESPRLEAELIPFYKIVNAYIKMDRLLRECDGQH